jgi:ABC-2 type transport system permease protein
VIASLRSLLFLSGYSLRRQLRSKKVFLSLLILAMIASVVFLAGLKQPWSARTFGEWVVLRLFGLFFLPVVTLMFGTGALGDDRDEKSLVYLITRPIPRWGIFAGKLAGVLPQVLLLTAGGLYLLHLAAGLHAEPDLAGSLGMYLLPIVLGALAYVSFFHFLGAAFRHSTLIAIAYVFFVEVFLGRVPGIMKRVSISFYTWSMVYDNAADAGVNPSPVFVPLRGELAMEVLIGIAVGFLLVGAWVFSRREYHDTA